MYDWCLLRKATHTVDYAWPYEADLTQRLDDPTSLVVRRSYRPTEIVILIPS